MSSDGELRRAARPVGLRQDHAAAHHRRARVAGRAARCSSTARTRPSGRAQRRRVGFVFQHYALFRHMTVFENVAFGLRVQPRAAAPGRGGDPGAGDELLALVQLDDAGRPAIRRSSPAASGSASRWRARSPSSRKVLLLDEPFGALDAKVRQELRRWLRRLHDELARHERLRHPRPGGGARARRPRRGDEPTAASSRSARRRRSTTSRRPRSSANSSAT